jgi:hypothetical protein
VDNFVFNGRKLKKIYIFSGIGRFRMEKLEYVVRTFGSFEKPSTVLAIFSEGQNQSTIIANSIK